LEKDEGNQKLIASNFFHRFLNIKCKNRRNICMVLEYCSQGTLEEYLKTKKDISEHEIIKIGL
jgi:hypothetical protein